MCTEFNPSKFCKKVTTKPGVYQMINNNGKIIYIGKAKNLRNRLRSYFNNSSKTTKVIQLVRNISNIEIVQTNSELEALILEHNLIKKHRPKYNVIFKDDKSFPYIEITTSHDYPGIYFKRGSKNKSNQYFGPYPNSYGARNSITIIQKAFKLRNCHASVFDNRSRPCLQHQINRCTAPCVDKISKYDYNFDVNRAIQFLQGKTRLIIDDISKEMITASNNKEFERAAHLRDQIIDLNQIIKTQIVSNKKGDFDVIGMALGDANVCVSNMFFRNGRLMGSKQSIVKLSLTSDLSNILKAYILKNYYDINTSQVKTIYVGAKLENKQLIESLIADRLNFKFRIIHPKQGNPKKWIDLSNDNASHTLEVKNIEMKKYQSQFHELRKQCNISHKLNRIECFDISHTSGNSATASCVVFNENGPKKISYRKFNINNVDNGDDYAALRQAFTRRYQRLINETTKMPDLIIIDGGKGQLSSIEEIATQLGITTPIISIAKGRARKRGAEKIYFKNTILPIDMSKPSGLLLQNIRDESHRFAITSHRKRRGKESISSSLDIIPGVGPKRKKSLLKHFGSIGGIQSASIQEISKVDGISNNIAQSIQNHLSSS